MVLSVIDDSERAVNLFSKHNACKLVRKGHFRHTQPCRRRFFHTLGKSERAADYKYDRSCAVCDEVGDFFGKRGTRKLFSLYAERNYSALGRDFRKHLIRLCVKRGGNFRVRGIFGKALRFKLDNLEFTKSGKPLFVFAYSFG